ncbi:uncharacterized protein [Diadema antillarum]|uniref:uncharacterized protein n=1 Tax=Diadema antillarum TaxID=105358 RepID=UPI003A8B7407
MPHRNIPKHYETREKRTARRRPPRSQLRENKEPVSPTPKAKKRALFATPQKQISTSQTEQLDFNVGGSQAENTGCEASDEEEDEEGEGEGEGEGEERASGDPDDSMPTPLEKAVGFIKSYRYLLGIRTMSKNSAPAKRAVITAAAEMIKNEVRSKPKLEAFQQEVNHTTVAAFSWEKALEEAEQSMPATVSCIWAMMPVKKNGENRSDLARKAGQILAIVLYTKCPIYKFVQSCIGIELWRQRVSHKVFTTLNHMGISQSADTARRNVDIIGKKHDDELWKWKESQEKPETQQTIKDTGGYSYGFCIDNIQVGTEAKHQRKGHGNKFLLQTMCFAVKDRVKEGSAILQVPASSLDPYTFLPSPDVFERQRARAVFLVQSLLPKHMTQLKHLQNKIPSRILHSHTTEMDEKSQCDSNNKFFQASSLADRGTIAQLKNEFNHRSFKRDAVENFQHVWDLYKFVTESHIVLCAMKLCGVSSLEDQPKGLPTEQDVEAQLKWLSNLSQRVVDFCWAPPDRGDVQVAAAGFDQKLRDVPDDALRYCFCNTKEKSDEMVMCCSKTCRHAWFHLSCVGLQEAPDSDEDWYCSQGCKDSDSYIYCFCHKKCQTGDEGMVQCHLAEHCKKHEWYHKSCVDISKDDPVADKWYCSDECSLGAENDDYILNHTKALMYEGLCHLVRRQAVREGDGPAMTDDWKADMIDFHLKNHPKYLINGHYFLACVGGFADPKLQLSFVWNRVANPKGRRGGNIGLDLVNEFMNLDYVGMVKSSGGSTTPQQLSRCAQMSGPFGKDLDALFTGAGIVDMEDSTRGKRTDLYDADIRRFTEEYQADALLDYIPGREHSGFGAFEGRCMMQNPKKLGEKLQSLSVKLDMWKNITSSSKKA